jgi:hypothetical protein
LFFRPFSLKIVGFVLVSVEGKKYLPNFRDDKSGVYHALHGCRGVFTQNLETGKIGRAADVKKEVPGKLSISIYDCIPLRVSCQVSSGIYCLATME